MVSGESASSSHIGTHSVAVRDCDCDSDCDCPSVRTDTDRDSDSSSPSVALTETETEDLISEFPKSTSTSPSSPTSAFSIGFSGFPFPLLYSPIAIVRRCRCARRPLLAARVAEVLALIPFDHSKVVVHSAAAVLAHAAHAQLTISGWRPGRRRSARWTRAARRY